MNVPNFLLPLLDVDSVGESLANAAYSGYGSTIYMPSLFNRLAITLVSNFREGLITMIERLINLVSSDSRGVVLNGSSGLCERAPLRSESILGAGNNSMR